MTTHYGGVLVRVCWRLWLGVGLTVFTSAPAFAQARSHAYVFAGPAGVKADWAGRLSAGVAGAGGDWLVAKGVGVGGELGIFSTLGVASANASWHFAKGSHPRLQPFVTTGMTHMQGDEVGFSAWNFGGGAVLWGQHKGLRLELRDHIRQDWLGTSHYWAMRFGLTFG